MYNVFDVHQIFGFHCFDPKKLMSMQEYWLNHKIWYVVHL